MIRSQGRWAVLAALLGLAVSSARAEGPALNFDKGVDVSGLVSGLRGEAKKEKIAVKAVKAAYRAERDCVNFSFEPAGPSVSESVWLRSTEYREECHWSGDPRHGGGQVCHEVPAWTHREKVQVELQGRQALLPWERERFQVCLEGRWLSIHTLAAAHRYRSDERNGYFTLTAGQRIAMAPDPKGIEAAAPRVVGSNLAVSFNDRWASYYPGETVAMKLELKRDIDGWFDSLLLTKELSFPVAASYEVDFSKYASEFSSQLKSGKKYYVKLAFRRLGKVSTDKQVDAGESQRTVFHPALQTIALR